MLWDTSSSISYLDQIIGASVCISPQILHIVYIFDKSSGDTESSPVWHRISRIYAQIQNALLNFNYVTFKVKWVARHVIFYLNIFIESISYYLYRLAEDIVQIKHFIELFSCATEVQQLLR
jgi:hypothetical protein